MSEQPTTAAAPAAPSHTQQSRMQRLFPSSSRLLLGLVVALIVLIIFGTIMEPSNFFNTRNFVTILRQASIIGVISIGMTFVITAGGIDLSVGAIVGLASVVGTIEITQTLAHNTHWVIMVVVAVLVGGVVGLVNGFVIAYGKVVAFMTTLAMMVGARGLAEIIGEKRTLVLGERGYVNFFNTKFLGMDMLIWTFIVVAVVGWILLNRTTFGRRTVAIGGNAEASRLAGINVKRHLMWLYTLAGICAGIAGAMIMARTTSGTSVHGQLYELDAIAAVVVGGTLLIGGRGTIVGTVLGVLIFETLRNLFFQLDLDSSAQAVTKGVIIVVAVLLQQRFAGKNRRGE